MTPTHAIKKGMRYRYYVSRRMITGVEIKSKISTKRERGSACRRPNSSA